MSFRTSATKISVPPLAEKAADSISFAQSFKATRTSRFSTCRGPARQISASSPSLGHRISSDDVIGTMVECFGKDFLSNQQAASNAQRFLDKSFTFPEASFDGALVWDAFQFLTSPLIEQAISQLFRILRPGAHLLLFFSANEKATSIPVYNYRIQDRKTLLQTPRPGTADQKSQYFNNRRLEKLFERASSMKFFLTRDHLREVIVRR